MTQHQTFPDFLAAAKPGEAYHYFTGQYLGWAPELKPIRRAYNDGQVTLTQRRNSAGSFDYLAVRLARSAKPAEPFVFD